MLDLINTRHSRYYKLYRKKQLENVIGSSTENPTHLANLNEMEEQMMCTFIHQYLSCSPHTDHKRALDEEIASFERLKANSLAKAEIENMSSGHH